MWEPQLRGFYTWLVTSVASAFVSDVKDSTHQTYFKLQFRKLTPNQPLSKERTNTMRQYLELLQHILEHGVEKADRTGTGTLSVFATHLKFDVRNSLPLLTTKKLHTKSLITELLWFISGSTNIKYLQERGVRIWNEWADANGELGPVYGAQWRSWEGADGQQYDQLANLIETLKKNPDSRRMIVSAWNVGALHQMALPPCHLLWQGYVANGELSVQVYQRSADVFLGVPFNIASYAILLCMLAQVTGYKPGYLTLVLGDAHLYLNHIAQAILQLTRKPYPLPTLWLNPDVKDINDFKYGDLDIIGYKSHPSIKAEISV